MLNRPIQKKSYLETARDNLESGVNGVYTTESFVPSADQQKAIEGLALQLSDSKDLSPNEIGVLNIREIPDEAIRQQAGKAGLAQQEL